MNKPLRGTVSHLPGSKSESNRALMIAAYGGFPLEVENLSDAHDTLLLKELLNGSSSMMDCEDAGTVARFLLTYLSGKPGEWLLTGTPRLCERPMAPLVDALRQLGATVITSHSVGEPFGVASEAKQSNQNSLPLRIIGRPIKGGAVTLDGSQSSQFASSLLMAAPTWDQGLELTLTGHPVSMPYLEMTIRMMEHYGIKIVRERNTITVAHQAYHLRPFTVSADWSAASYWYEMMALSDGGELLLKGLRVDSLQGDAVVAKWFEPLGVATAFEPEGARLSKTVAHPRGLTFDFTDHPDLFPAVCTTCHALGVDAVFKGTSTLFGKESDRLNALRTELSRIPHNAGPSALPVFRTYGDHRIAMSLAALWPQYGPVRVDDPSVVNKSYPGFWKDLELL